MCGIAGFAGFRTSAEAIDRVAHEMIATLAHRGPDDEGVWTYASRGVALAARRLAVVDLRPTGHQPMTSRSGRTTIAFNGEIYNHRDLRRLLAGEGVVFRGSSDTEVLVEAIDHWGARPALDRAVGMFALAVWDSANRRLVIARDRMGEKPLYYGRVGPAFVFGSELKALRRFPGFPAELDHRAVASYLRLGYVPAPSSIHRGIRKLEPGTLLELDPETGGGVPVRYWSLDEVAARGIAEPLGVGPEDAVDELEVLLGESVRLQMLADVPVGAFLSGGVDSSTVVALMQARATKAVRTFTIGFEDPTVDESASARAVAAHLGTEHTELRVTATAAMKTIADLPRIWDEPFADSSQIPTLLVSRLARRSVTVSLSGDGGDELFGGYDRYRWVGVLERARRMVPGVVRGAIRSATFSSALAAVAGLVPPAGAPRVRKALDALSGDGAYEALSSIWHHASFPVSDTGDGSRPGTPASPVVRPFERAMLADGMTYLPDDLLVKVDRAAMSCGLETRVPMLDHRIVEFAWRLPHAYRARGGSGKVILRRLLGRHIPPELIARPKAGFAVPVGSWLRGPLRRWAEDLLDPVVLRDQGVLDPAAVTRIWHDHQSGRASLEHELWAVLMLTSWLESTPTALQAR